jgi:hypothetical protein
MVFHFSLPSAGGSRLSNKDLLLKSEVMPFGLQLTFPSLAEKEQV